jgi:hypothetical protein
MPDIQAAFPVLETGPVPALPNGWQVTVRICPLCKRRLTQAVVTDSHGAYRGEYCIEFIPHVVTD